MKNKGKGDIIILNGEWDVEMGEDYYRYINVDKLNKYGKCIDISKLNDS